MSYKVEYTEASTPKEALDMAADFYNKEFKCSYCEFPITPEKEQQVLENWSKGNVIHFTFVDSRNTWWDGEYGITRGRKEYELRVKVIE